MSAGAKHELTGWPWPVAAPCANSGCE
jgi:hypothetical protein